MAEKKKLAVFFPGTGYHTDKPLFYYSRKIAITQGFETLCIGLWGLAETRREGWRASLGRGGKDSSGKGKTTAGGDGFFCI